MPFDPVVIGDIFPFEIPYPGFVGDSVKTAFAKINDGISSGGGGTDPSGPTPPNQYIDTAAAYTTFFSDGTSGTWVSATGTLTPDGTEPFGLWTTGASDYLHCDGAAIDTKRYTHLIVWAELVSSGYAAAQRGSYKNGSHGYNFTTYGTDPTGGQVALAAGSRLYVAFDLSAISDWFSVGSTGLAFKLSDTAGDVFKIWGIKLVGPNSSEVQTAATQAEISATLSAASATAAQAYRDAAEAFKDSASTYADTSQGYASDAQGFRDAAENFKNDAQQFSIDSQNNSLVATASGRFAHYLEPLTNGTFTFPSGTGSFTSNGTLSNVAGKLRATVASLNGYVQTPNMDFDGNHFSKIMVRMTWISGTLDPTQPFKDCWLYYNTTTRATFSASFEMRPQAWEVLQLNGANVVNLYFDATEQAGISDDWFGPDPIRSLRLYPAIASSSWVADIEYFYVLGDNVNYPYIQAQASANSASEAAAFENSAQTWAGASQTSATNAATSAGAASVSEGNAATSEASASGWATTAQSYAVLAAQASPGLQLTLNPVFMDWGSVATLPTGMVTINDTGVVIAKNVLNNIYSPQCLDVTVTTSTDTGFALRELSNNSPSKLVAIDNQYYVYEGVYELVSGTFANFSLRLTKQYTDTTNSFYIFATEADFVAAGSNRYTCSKLFSAPTTAGKTIDYINLALAPCSPSATNKRFIMHKHSLRVATADEVAANQVQTTINASVSAEAALRISGDNDINAKYTVKINANGYVTGYGLIATANNGTPTSEMVFQVDKFKVSDTGQTPKQMFAVGAVNGVTTMILNGNMIADGSITAKNMILADRANDLQNGNFSQGLEGWTRNLSSNVVVNTAGGLPAGAPSPFGLKMVRVTAETSLSQGNKSFDSDTNLQYGIPGVTGEQYYFEAWVYHSLGTTAVIDLVHRTPDGTVVGNAVPAQGSAPANTWTLMKGTFTSPRTGNLYLRLQNQVANSTQYVTNVRFNKMNAASLVVDGGITANKISVTDLSAISANLGSITVDTAHIQNLAVSTIKIADSAVTKTYYVETSASQTTSGSTKYSRTQNDVAWSGGPFMGGLTVNYSTSTTSTGLEIDVEVNYASSPGWFVLTGQRVVSSSNGSWHVISIPYVLMPPAGGPSTDTVSFRATMYRYAGTGTCTFDITEHLTCYFQK